MRTQWTVLKKLTLLLVPVFILLLISYFSLLKLHGKQKNLQEGKTQVLGVKSQTENQWWSGHLIIPKINVNAAVQTVGINSNGEMESPSNSVDVGWYMYGPRPGQTGSAVIAGHLDEKNGEPGVFAKLDKLQKGDKLYIDDGQGTTTAFTVRESHTFDAGYAEEVFNSSDSAHLNLVTCAGFWDNTKQSYHKRLVVFSDIVN